MICSNCESEFDEDVQGHAWHGDEENNHFYDLTDEEFAELAKRWASEGLEFCCMECECNYYRGE